MNGGKKRQNPFSVYAVVSQVGFMVVVPLLLFFYAVYVSFLRDGQAPEKIGCVGVAAVILAFLTFYVSVREARKEKVIKKVPIAGAVLSVLMIAGWTTVYVLGWIGL